MTPSNLSDLELVEEQINEIQQLKRKNSKEIERLEGEAAHDWPEKVAQLKEDNEKLTHNEDNLKVLQSFLKL